MSEISKDFVCPLCKWTCSNKSQMSVHIKFGHSQDDINGAVDDGRIIENPTFFFTPSTDAPNLSQSDATTATN